MQERVIAKTKSERFVLHYEPTAPLVRLKVRREASDKRLLWVTVGRYSLSLWLGRMNECDMMTDATY